MTALFPPVMQISVLKALWFGRLQMTLMLLLLASLWTPPLRCRYLPGPRARLLP